MQVAKDHLDLFKQFLGGMGASVSSRTGQTVAVCILGYDIISIQDTSGVVYEVKSTNVQALAQLREQWSSMLTKLAKETENDGSTGNET